MISFLAAVASAFLSLASAQAPGPTAEAAERVYTLDEALRLIRNDPRLQSAEQDVIIAHQRVSEAQLSFLPELGVQASATKFESRYPFSPASNFSKLLLFPQAPENIYSGRAYMSLPLYEGGRGLNTLRLAQTAEQQADSNRDSVKMDLAAQVKDAFYQLLSAQKKASAIEDYRRDAERDARDPGLGAWERVEVEASRAAADRRAAEAAHELESARLEFLKTLHLELDTPFRLAGELETRPISIETGQAVVWAMELRPELQSQTYRARMDAISVNLAFRRSYPTFFLAGDYDLTSSHFPLNNNSWDVSVGVKLPISWDYWTLLQEKQAEQRQGQLARADLQDRVRLEVRKAAENLSYWQREWQRREKRWREIQALYAAALEKPAAAAAKLRARAGLLDVKLSLLNAVTEHLLARAQLERAVGREIAP